MKMRKEEIEELNRMKENIPRIAIPPLAGSIVQRSSFTSSLHCSKRTLKIIQFHR